MILAGLKSRESEPMMESLSSRERGKWSPIARPRKQEVWTEKYRPDNVEDLVGNWDKIDEIEAWFKAYRERDKSIKRALLFSGPPGLGKTTLAHAILRKHGYQIKEYNASDVRSKKLVHKNLHNIIKVGYVDKYLHDDYRHFGIIMDEVDGMSSGDKGGMAELISFINPTRGKRSVKKKDKDALSNRWIPPIICICNDNTEKKMKDLKKDCHEIVFKKPNKKELEMIVERVARSESFIVTREATDLICGRAQGDYRRLLTILQNLVTLQRTLYKDVLARGQPLPAINKDLVDRQSKIFREKDLDLSLSEKVNGLFNTFSTPDALLKIYQTEKSLLPMMMHENYLDFIPLQMGINDFQKLGTISDTIDSIVMGDIIDKTMYNNQSWHLQPIHGLMSCWAPCFYANRVRKSSYKRVNFTTALGRFSFQRANQKNINGLIRKVNQHATYSLEDMRALSELILFNLLDPKGNRLEGIEFLEAYGLTIEDVKDLIKMNKLENHYAALHTSRVKTSLSKLWDSHIEAHKKDDNGTTILPTSDLLRDLDVGTGLGKVKIRGTKKVVALDATVPMISPIIKPVSTGTPVPTPVIAPTPVPVPVPVTVPVTVSTPVPTPTPVTAPTPIKVSVIAKTIVPTMVPPSIPPTNVPK